MKSFFEPFSPGSCHRAQWDFKWVHTPFLSPASIKKSGANMAQDLAMMYFHECLFNLELTDVSFLGPIFTWVNRQEGDNFIARKLDRCLQNECCLDIYQNVLMEVQHPGLSDHCPLVTSLNITPVLERRKKFPFKFFNFWTVHPAFPVIVKEAWECEVRGTPMYRLTQKMKRVNDTNPVNL